MKWKLINVKDNTVTSVRFMRLAIDKAMEGVKRGNRPLALALQGVMK